MSYTNQKLLLIAAEESHKEGSLTSAQFLKIMEDIETQVLKVDQRLLKEDVKIILEKYANI